MRRVRLAAVSVIALFCALVLVLSTAYAEGSISAGSQSSSSTAKLEINSLAGLDGKRIGILAGSNYDEIIRQHMSGTHELMYFSSVSDQISALKAHKIDAFATDEPVGLLAVNRNSGIGMISEPVATDNYGFFFQKGSSVTDKFSKVIDSLRNDGTLDKLKAKWCGADESAKTLPKQDWEATNGTLKMSTLGEQEPLTYVSNSQTIGYDIEVAMICCKELGYGLTVENQNSSAVMASVSTNKADFGGGGISITEERKKTYDFTTADYNGAVVAIVRTTDNEAAPSGGFWNGITSSFYKTFIQDGRWHLFVSGLGVTILISVCSGALGVLLGYVTVLARRSGVRWMGKLIDGYQALMGGVPIVVILMVLYYVVFGSIDIAGEFVAIIAFILSFGATAGSTMLTSITGIDSIQEECGLALSYTRREVFNKIIFPLARRQFTPQLLGQFVSLVKETSVVGYIAVQDLTRASDLVRSRTMDAFFPLISTAIIYFIFCRVLTWALNKLAKRIDINNRPRKIEGVEEV